MTVPRFAGKHGGEVLATATASLAHRRAIGVPIADRCPPNVVVTYQPHLFRALERSEAATAVPMGGLARLASLDRTDGRVGVVGEFGIGAPATAAVQEELIALGARRLIGLGVAGSLQPFEIGDVVTCTGAVRDEGVSHHYLPADAEVHGDPVLTDALHAALVDAGLIDVLDR